MDFKMIFEFCNKIVCKFRNSRDFFFFDYRQSINYFELVQYFIIIFSRFDFCFILAILFLKAYFT